MSADDRHGWTHAQCWVCWFDEYGLTRQPHRDAEPDNVNCCYCGQRTMSGIYRRTRPGSIEITHCADTQIDRSLFYVE